MIKPIKKIPPLSYWLQIRCHKKKCNLPSAVVAMYIRLEDGTYQCQTCNRKFSQQSNISGHIKNNTCKTFKVTKIQKCDVCLKTFKYKSTLERHKKTHEENKKVRTETTTKTHKISCKDFIPSQVFNSSTDLALNDIHTANYSNTLVEKELQCNSNYFRKHFKLNITYVVRY